MEMKSVKLDPDHYQKFLSGKEVFCNVSYAHGTIQTGDEVIVLRDSTANHTTASTPTRERQADYIGVKGKVTSVTRNPGGDGITLVKR